MRACSPERSEGVEWLQKEFGEHQTKGESGEQQNLSAEPLLRKRLEAARPIVGGAWPWSAGHGDILDHDFTLVSWTLGSDLGGRRLFGFSRSAIAPRRSSILRMDA